MKRLLFFLFLLHFQLLDAQVLKTDSLKKVLDRPLADSSRINTLNLLAEAVRYSDPEKMYQYAVEAKKLSLRNGYGKGLVKATYNLATYFETYRNEDSVQLYFKQSLQLADSLGDTHTYTQTRNAQGLYLVSKRRFEEALATFYEVLRRHEASENAYGQMAAHNNIGLVAMETRQYQSAISSFKRALPFQPQPHPVILNNIGSCYGSLTQYDSAHWYVTRGIERAKEINHKQAEANGLHILGSILMARKDYEQALETFLVAEKVREQAPSKAMQIADYTNISSLYARLGKPDLGLSYGQKALAIAESEKLEYKVENIYEALAQNYLATGEYNKASEFFRKWGVEKDSAYARAQSEALAEMKTRYEIEKKEQEIQIKDLQLAEQELLLNQRNLQLYSSIGGGGVLLILLYLAYNRLQLQKQVQQLELVNKMQLERERISSDLHDHVGAQLTSILAGLQVTDQMAAFRDKEAAELITSLKEDARETLTSLRDSIWSLHHNEISLQDFVEHTDRQLLSNLKYLPQIKYSLDASGADLSLKLGAREALNLSRIIQEGIHNIVKHSSASRLTLQFITDTESIKLVLSDNGKGFEMPAENSSQFGIENMRRRTTELNGHFEIASRPGKGTAVTLRIPKMLSNIV